MYEDHLLQDARERNAVKNGNKILPTIIKAASEPSLSGDAPAGRGQALLHEARNNREAAERLEQSRQAKILKGVKHQ
jgi:hypothetical protein